MRLPWGFHALVNASDAFPDLERLKRDFDILYFLDLCVGIEAAVLYDKLYLTEIGPGAEPILEPLAHEGILSKVSLKSEDPAASAYELISRPRAKDLMSRLEQVNTLQNDEIDLAIPAQVAAMRLPTDLAVEEEIGVALVLPFRQMSIYVTLPSIELE